MLCGIACSLMPLLCLPELLEPEGGEMYPTDTLLLLL